MWMMVKMRVLRELDVAEWWQWQRRWRRLYQERAEEMLLWMLLLLSKRVAGREEACRRRFIQLQTVVVVRVRVVVVVVVVVEIDRRFVGEARGRHMQLLTARVAVLEIGRRVAK